MTELLIALGGLGIGGIVSTIITRFGDRDKTQGEIDSLAVSTADNLIRLVNDQLASEKAARMALEKRVDRMERWFLASGMDPEHVVGGLIPPLEVD